MEVVPPDAKIDARSHDMETVRGDFHGNLHSTELKMGDMHLLETRLRCGFCSARWPGIERGQGL